MHLTPSQAMELAGPALDELLENMAVIPDDTTEVTRRTFRSLKGKPFFMISGALRALMASNTLTPMAREHTRFLVEFSDMAAVHSSVSIRI